MFKKTLIAVAILVASPELVSAQDIIWSFSRTELSTTSSAQVGESGSAYIFTALPFNFDAMDLNFTTSTSCVEFTGGETFNSAIPGGGMRFDSVTLTIDAEGRSGNLFLVNVTNGPFPSPFPCPFNAFCIPSIHPDFEPDVGPNGAFIVARVDFDIVGDGGAAELEFALGQQGALRLPNIVLDPSLGSATLDLQSDNPPLLGDVDLNGVVNFFDIGPFISVLSNGGDQPEADCNQDCEVDFRDIADFIAILSSQ